MKLYNPKIMQVQNMHVSYNNMQKFQNHNPDAYFWMLALKLGMSGQWNNKISCCKHAKKKWNFIIQNFLLIVKAIGWLKSCVVNFKTSSVAKKYRYPQKVWPFSKTLQPKNWCSQQWCASSRSRQRRKSCVASKAALFSKKFQKPNP